MRRAFAPLAVVLLGVLGASPIAARQPGAPPRPSTSSPPLAVDAQLAFLASAKVVSTRRIGKGTTGALRVTLSDGGLTHDAAFQSIATEPFADGRKRAGELRFADHYRYNVAAWRLAVLLGLGEMMPPTVERRIGGRLGALSWWIDDVAMDEAEREATNAQPREALPFSRQRQAMSIFAELVRDMDRNKGNIVYTTDWRVIMIDFTRAFRLDETIRTPSQLATCSRSLLAAMQGLTKGSVERAVAGALTEREIAAVLARRDLVVQHFQQLIQARGEAIVLY